MLILYKYLFTKQVLIPKLSTSEILFLYTTGPYSVVMDNFQVVGNVSKSFEAVSALTCAVRCAQTDNCFAFNFLESSVTCELVLSLNEFVPFTESNLIQQTGWRVFALSLPFTEIVSLQEVLEVVIVDDP